MPRGGTTGGNTAAPYVSIEHVEMRFGVDGGHEVHALDNVELGIAHGEFCCLIGPSGCGKSTLLRIVDGLIPPTAGRVVIDGVPTSGPRLDLGVVFQSFNLLPWRTVAANVALGLEERGVGREERRRKTREWLGMVGLSGFEDFYPSQLSGGMQQRVGIARALAIEPSILLMDEPFGSVDAQTRLIMQSELLRIWAGDRKTVIFVTHDVEEALFLSDRVITFSERPGRIIDAIDVPFPRPRVDALRGDPEFARLKEQLWEKLKRNLSASPAVQPDEPEATRRRWNPIGRR